MNWWDWVILSAITVYPLVGMYIGVRWTWWDIREEGLSGRELWLIPFVVVMLCVFWLPVFMTDPNLKKDMVRCFKKTPKSTKMLARESRRMNKEYALEEARVQLMEVQATHRDRMHELAERRRKIEDTETDKVLNS